MDRYDNATTQNTEEREEEPFYCSPAGPEGDIICPGSDAEETAGEIQQKHLRYEYHARRYLQGDLPVLQSATLRGPFRGWVNPWRRVPRVEEDWWQPSSENMLFTRENVMRRAVDHGLGYLSPTEALAWCKASAQAEAQRINGETSVERDTRPELRNTLMVVDPNETPEQHPTKDEPVTFISNPTTSYGKQSMVNHHSNTPNIGEPASDNSRGMKRPVESQWLKGSYISKRARWDGPAVSTPTPYPETGARPRRRHQSFPKRSASSNTTTNGPARLAVSFADIKSETSQIDISALRPKPTSIASTGGGNISATFTRLSKYRGSSLERSSDPLQQQEDEIDEFHCNSQKSGAASKSQKGSQIKSKRRSRNFADASSLDPELDDLKVIILHQNSSPGSPASGLSRQNGASSSRSNRLPKLPHSIPSPRHGVDACSVDDLDEYSFITEVAPSSLGLELFQYRKKRRRKDSEAMNSNSNVTGVVVDYQKSPQMTLESQQNDEDEHQPDDLSLIKDGSANKTDVSRDIIKAPASEDETREKGNPSDGSWDFMDDVMHAPAPQLVQNGMATATFFPRQCSLIPQAVGIASKISNQYSNISFRSSQLHQSQSLPDPQKQSLRPSSVGKRAGISQDPNDMSTQSHDTSPRRPAVNTPSEISPEAKSVHVQHEVRSEEIQYVMGDIQITHSQHCSISPSVASTQSDNYQGSEIDCQNGVGVRSIREPQHARRHVPHSTDPHSSSQTSVEGNETRMECQVGTLTEPTIVNEDRRGQHTQQDPNQKLDDTETTEMNPELGVTVESCTRTATTTQDGFSEDTKGQHARTRTDSRGPMTDGRKEETSVGSASGKPRRVLDTRTETYGQCDGDEPGPNKTADMDSENSREDCGPQSPWAAENLELLTTRSEKRIRDGLLNTAAFVIGDPGKGDNPPEKSFGSEQQNLHHLERPQTPQMDIIKPFADLMSPTPAQEVPGSHSHDDGLPSTQLLVDAATKNPWTSNLRNPSSKKSKKRVSFRVLPSEGKENSQLDRFDNSDLSKRSPGSPPPPQDHSDENTFDDGTTSVHPFRMHFVAARQFQHILPRSQSSLPNSSPAFGAQAEAFIAADRDASTRKRRSMISRNSPSRHKPSVDRIQENSWSRETSLSSFQTNPKVSKTRFGTLAASFDMEDALHDAGDFLEDWSVDVELKRAKEPECSSRRESNGYRRRKLFGLVQKDG